MIFSQDVISEVRLLNDIVQVISGYVKLNPRSGNHVGLCPFHNEKTPSFSVNSEKQIYYCFGCGAGGDVFRFVQQHENLDFPQALQMLADRVNYALPKKPMSQAERNVASERERAAALSKRAAVFFYEYLNSEEAAAAAAREYLDKRGIGKGARRRFGLGLSPDRWDGLISHMADVPPEELIAAGLAKKSDRGQGAYDCFRGRLMFPIIDGRNRVAGFGGRTMNDGAEEAKYINTPETALFKKKELLYGMNLAKKRHGGEVIVAEGYMDVIALHQSGAGNAVGVLGTALAAAHARTLTNAGVRTAVLLMDSDAAGQKAAERAIPILTEAGLRVKVLELGGAKDPDEFLAKFGKEEFAKQLRGAKSHVAFQMGLALGRHDIGTTEGKIAFTSEAAGILAKLDSSIEIDAYARDVAEKTEISHAAIVHEVGKIKPLSARGEPAAPPGPRAAARGSSKGAVESAKKSLVRLAATHPVAARALEKSRLLTKEDLGDWRLEALLGLCFRAASEGRRLASTELMDLSEKDECKRLVAEIFVSDADYADDKAVEKALNDYAKKIKREHLFSKLSECRDTGDAAPVHREIRELEQTVITI